MTGILVYIGLIIIPVQCWSHFDVDDLLSLLGKFRIMSH